MHPTARLYCDCCSTSNQASNNELIKLEMIELDRLFSLQIQPSQPSQLIKSAVTMASEPSSPRELIPYEYKPLRSERQIRLLRLFPASTSSEIRVEFSVPPSTDPEAPEFEALSYAWVRQITQSISSSANRAFVRFP
jgi:hypothetical protein